MTGPETTPPGSPDPGGALREATSVSTLRKRRDFLAAARARVAHAAGFVVQARSRAAQEPSATPLRVGFTCSRKVGNAVARNRAKRRLREAARAILPVHGRPGWDYVLIGRAGTTASLPMDQLRTDLAAALDRLHGA